MEFYGRMFSYLAYMRTRLEFLVPKAEKEKEGGRGKKGGKEDKRRRDEERKQEERGGEGREGEGEERRSLGH